VGLGAGARFWHALPVRSLRVLLLQARKPDDPMKGQEVRCFAAKLGLPEASVVPHDLLAGAPLLRTAREHDAVFVGGSGDFCVSKSDLPHLERTLDLMREISAVGHPTFGSCFGYHLLVRALGGNVVHDPERSEVGTFELELTEAGKNDPLFGTMPERFHAQLGHNDRAEVHPEGLANLAASERSPLQALRVPGAPVWATQFHPELDREACCDRYRAYHATYGGPGDPEAVMRERFLDTPHSSDLLARFLRLVFA
jgi:GMP synthase (glutamine-hydrolysing)